MRTALFLLAFASSVRAGTRFEVKPDPKFNAPAAGRLLVSIVPKGERPRFTDTDPPGFPLLGVDVSAWPMTVDGSAMTYPLTKLDALPPGEYAVQAILATNRDVNLPNAPGNLYSVPTTAKLPGDVSLVLSQAFAEATPKDTATVKYLKIPSKLLSDFHGRPMVYRVGVALPPNFDANPEARYPLLVNVGGFGTRYTGIRRSEGDARFVQILLDGAGPYGYPYQVNSANNGPYGDALTTEVIPFVEKTYRCLGTPKSRFTAGGSTGGWVSLALQIFYPDVFNGCWSQCPDGIDFRALELIDIYSDANAYVNRFGFERTAKRTLDGDTIYTVRHENQIERVLGRGGRWELSGRDWGCWNATYGPRGADGLPKPLWDGATGAIDKSVLDHWKKYDLRLRLTQDWPALAPKLAGKIHIWVGDADDYFLNNAVHRFKAATASLSPKFDGEILIEMRKPHGSGGWSREQMLAAMAARAK